MPTPLDADFAARLQALNDKFAASLPGTLDKLAAARARFDAAAPDQTVAAELHGLLHSIAGSAGTFGFPLLGQYARIVEQNVRRLLSGTEPPLDWAAWADQFDGFLAWAKADPQAPYTV
ncbi:Hpt domain-containing protein [Massilia arenosa]|uniref:Hpt domain-containing protein n=1 Tax=Zemynaea arenosa TaxID=2561931 RepID=A0A4Y9RTR6_9BURK|nr:Hpt domain-containing protein [Massilia arenosa]TFW11295.1 Hpt domain-containing protein [Massilia arenosa]